MIRRHPRGRAAAGSVLLALVLLLSSGCSFFDPNSADPEPAETTSASASSDTETTKETQFTRDGTFQSHLSVPGAKDVDFVFTVYPTKATPRTNEWYPRGSKYFTFTFQAYDLAQGLRDPFATKRMVYLDRIKVSSVTVTAGSKVQHPYTLNAVAKKITLDPEPVTTKYGMLITSPKGAFELRNQRIKPSSLDTTAVKLTFTATVHVEKKAGSSTYLARTVTQTVPMTIFASEEKTAVADIPVDAN
ncbi:hypothetical protein [Nocardioides sp. GY 10127]|uniref:hypothetical protein n=1 Tax=Nocardioides sp. GY 10127 TaxID=2569762 RepID=UPI0010A86A64|nr:hypothetical protein [Nocardioides sp. GY 10127]TIC84255.1 hypothetical protein E8D37_05590 [Nocardioides sp. GY 10127]